MSTAVLFLPSVTNLVMCLISRSLIRDLRPALLTLRTIERVERYFWTVARLTLTCFAILLFALVDISKDLMLFTLSIEMARMSNVQWDNVLIAGCNYQVFNTYLIGNEQKSKENKFSKISSFALPHFVTISLKLF
jgi:hypothetical protein